MVFGKGKKNTVKIGLCEKCKIGFRFSLHVSSSTSRRSGCVPSSGFRSFRTPDSLFSPDESCPSCHTTAECICMLLHIRMSQHLHGLKCKQGLGKVFNRPSRGGPWLRRTKRVRKQMRMVSVQTRIIFSDKHNTHNFAGGAYWSALSASSPCWDRLPDQSTSKVQRGRSRPS